jgi:hypothetical protein
MSRRGGVCDGQGANATSLEGRHDLGENLELISFHTPGFGDLVIIKMVNLSIIISSTGRSRTT